MGCFWKGVCLLAWLVFACAQQARAQTGVTNANSGPFSIDIGPVHLGILGGATETQDVRWSGSGSIGGLRFSGTGKLSFRTGRTIAGFATLPLNSRVQLVAQLAYSKSDFNKFSGRLDLLGIGSIPGPLHIDGQIQTLTGFADVVLVPFGRRLLTPYVGAGIGFNYGRTSLNRAYNSAFTLPINQSSAETNLAADALAGVNYSINDHAAAGLSYQYIRVAPGNLGSGRGISARSGFVQVHFFGGLLIYNF